MSSAFRPATVEDIPQLLLWGRKFHEAAGLLCKYDDAAVSGLLTGMMSAETGAVIICDTGFIGGVISPSYCDPEWLMAVELFWWAEKRGLELLQAFEAWAASMGAKEVRMTSLAALPRADLILRRKGYAPTEISYQKVI